MVLVLFYPTSDGIPDLPTIELGTYEEPTT